jgi:hypothetical protein
MRVSRNSTRPRTRPVGHRRLTQRLGLEARDQLEPETSTGSPAAAGVAPAAPGEARQQLIERLLRGGHHLARAVPQRERLGGAA